MGDPTEIDGGSRAAIEAASEIAIAADRNAVWSLLTDFERWPSWNRDVRSVEVDGPLREGMVFGWRAGPVRIVSTIRQLNAPQAVAWTGKTFGIRAAHTWSLEGSNGQTNVRTRETWDGPLVRLVSGATRKMLQRSLDSGLRSLKEAAERGVRR